MTEHGNAIVKSLRLTAAEWADVDRLVARLPPARELLSDSRHDNGRNREQPSRAEAIAHAVREALRAAE